MGSQRAPSTPLREVLALLAAGERGGGGDGGCARRVYVLGERGEPLGVISLTDVLGLWGSWLPGGRDAVVLGCWCYLATRVDETCVLM